MNADRSQKIIIIVLAVLLVGVSAALIIKIIQRPAPQPAIVSNENTNANTNANVNEYSNPNPDNIPEPVTPGHDIINTKTINFLSSPEIYDAQQISDRLGIKITALTETAPRDSTKNYSDAYSLVFKKLGTVNGLDLYDIAQSCVSVSGPDDDMMAPLTYLPEGCDNFDVLANFDPAKKKFFVYSKHSMGVGQAYRSLPDSFPTPLGAYAAKTDGTISDLAVPAVVTLPYGYALSAYFPALTLSGTPNSSNDNPQIKYALAGTSLEGYNIYQESPTSSVYYLKIDGFGYGQYSLKIPFYGNGRVPQITWNDGTKNDTDYSPLAWRSDSGPFDGYGEVNTLPSGEATNFYERFTAAGKCSNGEYAYVPKSDTDQIFSDYPFLSGNPQEKESAGPKAFLTKNPFDKIIIWTKTELLPMAERGKPVVYLYPTETKNVSVKLGDDIKVLKSEPAYGSGWTVKAQPHGTLTTADGSQYPYLYWDGDGPAYAAPKQGWVIASNDVDSFLSSKLVQLGLSAKEASDFRAFWVPIVSKSPYALISFVPQDEWSKATPLTIFPAPETVIRVFMDWKPLAAPIAVEPQVLPPTPVRSGFTAVEWGGLLYK